VIKTALLDVNVLVALSWPDHVHHSAALRWHDTRGNARWATCPLTQLAFVRLISNPAFSKECLSPAQATRLLTELTSHSRHEFWPDDLAVNHALGERSGGLHGHKQITDCYLLALAARRKASLATFDRGIKSLVAESESLVEFIE
jgi:toxin-antitoxin system PIN domain toxin